MILQRIARHEHPDAVAEALRGIPRTAAFDGLEALAGIARPPWWSAAATAPTPTTRWRWRRSTRAASRARLVVEEEGESPLAWRGGALSKVIPELVDGA